LRIKIHYFSVTRWSVAYNHGVSGVV